jgi:hypothetical protein
MLDSWAKILTVLSGIAVLVSFARGNHAASEIFAFLVAIMSAADLVFGFSAKPACMMGFTEPSRG